MATQWLTFTVPLVFDTRPTWLAWKPDTSGITGYSGNMVVQSVSGTASAVILAEVTV